MKKGVLLAVELILISFLVLINFIAPGINFFSKPVPIAAATAPAIGFGDLIVAHPALSSPTSSPTPLSTSAPVPTSGAPSKNFYKIAVIGDSMVETMGENLDYLQAALKKKYPKTSFSLYNYGIGSENIIEALARIDNEFVRDGRNMPPITKPSRDYDIIIVGSWAYNPIVPFDQNLYWSKLALVYEKVKATGTQTYALTEIAPLKDGFGVGPGGVNWPNEIVYPHVEKIISQLSSSIALAKSINLPLIDAFTPSREGSTPYGQKKYVNSHDGIHPSILGHQFIAEIIARAVALY